MKIGITGTNGFIGRSVAQSLTGECHEIVVLDRYTRILNQKGLVLDNCPNDLNWILHFGASTSIAESWQDPFSTYSNNFSATLLALKIAHHSKASFLFMSSYVYGQPQYVPIDEQHPVSSVNPYMGSKILGEELCKQMSETFEIPLIILRAFNIYGDVIIPGRLISDLLDAVRKGKPIIINDACPKRDYLYIKDFNSLIHKIISLNSKNLGIYNVGSGCNFSNLEIANMVREISKEKRPVYIKSRERLKDISDCTADVSLVKKTFSWSPKYTLYNVLSELIS